jgi:pimeloyl-ACP methyl ester carboxylesterase
VPGVVSLATSTAAYRLPAARLLDRDRLARLQSVRFSMSIQTHYTKSGEVFIAYQVTGEGPVDLLMAPGFISHVDHAWEEPQLARWINEMSSFARFIRFDKRGTGLSDRSVGIPHLDERMDDIRAVLDSVGSRKAALIGVSEGGPMSILFAAT